MKKFILILFLILFGQLSFAQNSKIIRVNNAQEFVNAIGNNTIIIVNPKELDISMDSLDIGIVYNEVYEVPSTAKVFYLPNEGLTIRGVNNLTINSEDTCNLVTQNTDDNVLKLENCKDISISNFKMYHNSKIQAQSNSAALKIVQTDNLRGKNLELSSCKTGLDATLSNNLQLYKLRIFENSEYAISALGCNKVNLDSSIINDNNLKVLFNIKKVDLYDDKTYSNRSFPSKVTLSDCEVFDNTAKKYVEFGDIDMSKLIISYCSFYYNNVSDSKLNDLVLSKEDETVWDNQTVNETE